MLYVLQTDSQTPIFHKQSQKAHFYSISGFNFVLQFFRQIFVLEVLVPCTVGVATLSLLTKQNFTSLVRARD